MLQREALALPRQLPTPATTTAFEIWRKSVPVIDEAETFLVPNHPVLLPHERRSFSAKTTFAVLLLSSRIPKESEDDYVASQEFIHSPETLDLCTEWEAVLRTNEHRTSPMLPLDTHKRKFSLIQFGYLYKSCSSWGDL